MDKEEETKQEGSHPWGTGRHAHSAMLQAPDHVGANDRCPGPGRQAWEPLALSAQSQMYVSFSASSHPLFKGMHESLRAKKPCLLDGQ